MVAPAATSATVKVKVVTSGSMMKGDCCRYGCKHVFSYVFPGNFDREGGVYHRVLNQQGCNVSARLIAVT